MKSLSMRALFLFSIPSILSSVLEPLASVVDTALVGKLHTDSLAALAICTIIFNSFSWIFNFLVHTSMQAISASLSQNNQVLYRERLKITILLAFYVGLFSSLFLFATRFWLYQLAGSSKSLIPLIDDYFCIRVCGHIFTILYMTLLGILRGQQNVGVSFYIVTTTTLINIILTWLLLFKYEYGLAGAAVGTVVSNILGFLFCSFFIFKKVSFLQVFKAKAKKSTWIHFGKNSWDMFGRSFFLTAAFFLSTRFASLSSTTQLAAHQILLQLWLFSSFFVDGIAMTGNILGAQYYTQKKAHELAILSKRLLQLGAVIGLGFLICFLIFKNFIFALFTNDTQVIDQLNAIWLLIALTQIINALSFVYDGLLFGHGAFAYLRKQIMIGVLVCFLPISLYGLSEKSIIWIWVGLCLLNIYRMLTGYYKTNKNIESLALKL